MTDDPSKWVEETERWDTDKHYEERKVNGFSTADWINFDTYIAWVIAEAVRKMKSDGHTMFSYIGQPEDTWEALTHEEYDVMIHGFSQYVEHRDSSGNTTDYKKIYDDLDKALEVFKVRFKSLWD